jgi:small subunit ribosomal protein S19
MTIPFIDYELYIKVKNSPVLEDTVVHPKGILTQSRTSHIPSNFIGKTIAVYNGKKHKPLKITHKMIGQKLGQFVLTKKIGSSIHNSERNRKRKEKQRRKITQRKVRKTSPVKQKSVSKKK